MNKSELLAAIQDGLRSGIVTQDEVRSVVSAPAASESHATSRITNVLYVIGAIIAVIGVIILVAQNWHDIGFAGRVLVTAGIALATYVAGLWTGQSQRVLSQVMFTITAALAPIGVAVIVDRAGIELSPAVHAWTGLLVALMFASAFWHTRRNILVLLITGYLTWAFMALVAALFDITADIGKWTAMTIGASYLLAAWYYHLNKGVEDSSAHKEKGAVENIMYGLGTGAMLCPSLFFDGLVPDLLAIALIFGFFYLSVFVRSKMTLIVSAFFLVVHIVMITAEYFADSISWPLALILIGFLVIGIGYATLYISRTYLSSRPQA